MDPVVCRCDDWKYYNQFANVGEGSLSVQPIPNITENGSQQSDQITQKPLPLLEALVISANILPL